MGKTLPQWMKWLSHPAFLEEDLSRGYAPQNKIESAMLDGSLQSSKRVHSMLAGCRNPILLREHYDRNANYWAMRKRYTPTYVDHILNACGIGSSYDSSTDATAQDAVRMLGSLESCEVLPMDVSRAAITSHMCPRVDNYGADSAPYQKMRDVGSLLSASGHLREIHNLALFEEQRADGLTDTDIEHIGNFMYWTARKQMRTYNRMVKSQAAKTEKMLAKGSAKTFYNSVKHTDINTIRRTRLTLTADNLTLLPTIEWGGSYLPIQYNQWVEGNIEPPAKRRPVYNTNYAQTPSFQAMSRPDNIGKPQEPSASAAKVAENVTPPAPGANPQAVSDGSKPGTAMASKGAHTSLHSLHHSKSDSDFVMAPESSSHEEAPESSSHEEAPESSSHEEGSEDSGEWVDFHTPEPENLKESLVLDHETAQALKRSFLRLSRKKVRIEEPQAYSTPLTTPKQETDEVSTPKKSKAEEFTTPPKTTVSKLKHTFRYIFKRRTAEKELEKAKAEKEKEKPKTEDVPATVASSANAVAAALEAAADPKAAVDSVDTSTTSKDAADTSKSAKDALNQTVYHDAPADKSADKTQFVDANSKPGTPESKTVTPTPPATPKPSSPAGKTPGKTLPTIPSQLRHGTTAATKVATTPLPAPPQPAAPVAKDADAAAESSDGEDSDSDGGDTTRGARHVFGANPPSSALSKTSTITAPKNPELPSQTSTPSAAFSKALAQLPDSAADGMHMPAFEHNPAAAAAAKDAAENSATGSELLQKLADIVRDPPEAQSTIPTPTPVPLHALPDLAPKIFDDVVKDKAEALKELLKATVAKLPEEEPSEDILQKYYDDHDSLAMMVSGQARTMVSYMSRAELDLRAINNQVEDVVLEAEQISQAAPSPDRESKARDILEVIARIVPAIKAFESDLNKNEQALKNTLTTMDKAMQRRREHYEQTNAVLTAMASRYLNTANSFDKQSNEFILSLQKIAMIYRKGGDDIESSLPNGLSLHENPARHQAVANYAEHYSLVKQIVAFQKYYNQNTTQLEQKRLDMAQALQANTTTARQWLEAHKKSLTEAQNSVDFEAQRNTITAKAVRALSKTGEVLGSTVQAAKRVGGALSQIGDSINASVLNTANAAARRAMTANPTKKQQSEKTLQQNAERDARQAKRAASAAAASATAAVDDPTVIQSHPSYDWSKLPDNDTRTAVAAVALAEQQVTDERAKQHATAAGADPSEIGVSSDMQKLMSDLHEAGVTIPTAADNTVEQAVPAADPNPTPTPTPAPTTTTVAATSATEPVTFVPRPPETPPKTPSGPATATTPVRADIARLNETLPSVPATPTTPSRPATATTLTDDERQYLTHIKKRVALLSKQPTYALSPRGQDPAVQVLSNAKEKLHPAVSDLSTALSKYVASSAEDQARTFPEFIASVQRVGRSLPSGEEVNVMGNNKTYGPELRTFTKLHQKLLQHPHYAPGTEQTGTMKANRTNASLVASALTALEKASSSTSARQLSAHMDKFLESSEQRYEQALAQGAAAAQTRLKKVLGSEADKISPLKMKSVPPTPMDIYYDESHASPAAQLSALLHERLLLSHAYRDPSLTNQSKLLEKVRMEMREVNEQITALVDYHSSTLSPYLVAKAALATSTSDAAREALDPAANAAMSLRGIPSVEKKLAQAHEGFMDMPLDNITANDDLKTLRKLMLSPDKITSSRAAHYREEMEAEWHHLLTDPSSHPSSNLKDFETPIDPYSGDARSPMLASDIATYHNEMLPKGLTNLHVPEEDAGSEEAYQARTKLALRKFQKHLYYRNLGAFKNSMNVDLQLTRMQKDVFPAFAKKWIAVLKGKDPDSTT